MYERFHSLALETMDLSEKEARSRNHEVIATDSILLALICQVSSPVPFILDGMNVNRSKLHMRVDERAPADKQATVAGKLSLAPLAKQAIVHARAEAHDLGKYFIRPEHLFLGLVKAEEGVGGEILREAGVTFKEARRRVIEVYCKWDLGEGASSDLVALEPAISEEARQWLDKWVTDADLSLDRASELFNHLLSPAGANMHHMIVYSLKVLADQLTLKKLNKV